MVNLKRTVKAISVASLISATSVLAQNCNLQVPANPLTSTGLATPYLLSASDTASVCQQNNTGASAFVQGTILDLDTGNLYIYNPLVITKGTTAKIAPTAPNLPANSVVGLWFGFNGGVLTLTDNANGANLAAGNCVTGAAAAGNVFGQFSYCNAVAFFNSARNLIENGVLHVPALGTASDGLPCPTTRDWMVVDMDQSDNVLSSYLIDPTTQRMAQNTAANRALLAVGNPDNNASDNRLLDIFILPALGCSPWKVPDLSDAGNNVSSLALNEILAQYNQRAPQAMIPGMDPMVLDTNGNPNTAKNNLYRQGVFQPIINDVTIEANTTTYCQNLVGSNGAYRIYNNRAALRTGASPMTGFNTLYDFLINRLNASVGNMGLNCQAVGVNLPNLNFNDANPTTSTGTSTTQAVAIGLGVTAGVAVLGAVAYIIKRKRDGIVLGGTQWNSNFAQL